MHSHRPVWHCLAFTGVWYAALVLLNLATDGHVLPAAMLGVVPWLGSAVALMRFDGVRAWRLVLLGLPIFCFLRAITAVVASRFTAPPQVS